MRLQPPVPMQHEGAPQPDIGRFARADDPDCAAAGGLNCLVKYFDSPHCGHSGVSAGLRTRVSNV